VPVPVLEQELEYPQEQELQSTRRLGWLIPWVVEYEPVDCLVQHLGVVVVARYRGGMPLQHCDCRASLT
jgi:hypothetical protein